MDSWRRTHRILAVVVPDNVLFEGGQGDGQEKAPGRVRRAYAPTPAHGPVLRPGGQGERAVLRQKAGKRNALDKEALDLRSPHEHALRAQDELPPAH